MKLLNKILSLPKDKFIHSYVCTILTNIVYCICSIFVYNTFDLILLTFYIVLTIGVLKEIIDVFTNGSPEFYDIVADVVGCIIGLVFIILIANI